VDRLACVDAAALPLQILLQDHPEWVQLPVAVVEDDRPQAAVLFLNERARKSGVRPGHKYAAALALAPDLQAAVVQHSRVEDTVRTLADHLRRYSPSVEPSTATPGLFWIDASGLNRLYPSIHDWASAVRYEMQRAGIRATVAVGVSRFGAYALAKCHQGITVCVNEAEERSVVERAPLAALDLDPGARDRLAALGIHTVGAFLRLPPDALKQRLGGAADAVYQLASGRTWAPLVPVPEEERYERQIDFDAPDSNTERVLFVVKRLLDALAGDLERRGRAVVDLTLDLTLDDRSRREEHVRPASPTMDPAQLLPLVRLRLDAVRLSAGIVALRVAADTCGAGEQQIRLLSHGRRDPDAANQAFARLRAELGEDAVMCARLRDAHLPGARFTWEPMTHMPASTHARVVAARPLIRRIFSEASRAPNPETRASESRATGRFIFSGAWWRGGFRRDYYFEESKDGGLQWMYYDHRRKRAFLQGDVE